jgi:polar amino acid transport system substrate-binding protein
VAQDAPLRAGIDPTFAPHAMPNLSGGEPEGFNVDLAKALAKRLGRELVLETAAFSAMIPSLQAGTYDFVASPVGANAERAENLLFTEGYINTDFQFILPKNAPDVTTLEGFYGKTIAVNTGSTYGMWADGLTAEAGWKIESYGTTPDAVQAVLSGRADAILTGNTGAAWVVKNNPALKLSYLYETGLVFSVPLRKDSAELRDTLDRAIECMKSDGEIAAIYEKWFGMAPAPDSPVVKIYPGYGVPELPGYDPTPHELSCQ